LAFRNALKYAYEINREKPAATDNTVAALCLR
jgi:hypothetical protein